MTLEELITRHEGLRLKPYFDCCGRFFRDCDCPSRGKKQGDLTIGVGRNIEKVGISAEEAFLLRDNDIAKAERQADAAFPWYKDLSQARQWIVIDMIFNLGIMGFLGFRNMIAALQKQDYRQAADEMINSHWHEQVGGRAAELSELMRKGAIE